ncbi:RNA-directed DNA polymerase from mobile element jockey [Eumeta japonica]|uniref:RNA-directed DNA polymerase from mobile element jockey n=1 Tax=Eumeta variegata TaxID=151549 RepID=A0A4C1UXI4_EUMVA|nr:RNA-directed DNA polymerase from mobile element jockey [Eumeta japonica]
MKARVQAFRNESWSDLMEEIRPSHQVFWKITKALKTEGYTPIPPLKRPNGSIALDDAEVAECLADSIETQCSHVSPPHDIAHINSIEEEVKGFESSEVNPDKSAAIQFKYSKNKSKLVVDWNTPNLKMLNARIPWQRSYKYLGVTLDKNLHFREHIARVRKNALFYTARLGAILGRKSKLSRRNKRTLYKMCIRTVMMYACPVFAHAAPKALYRLQVIQNKFCRAATDAHWCVRNSILHRDLELPILPKYMKDASKRFFDIAGSHPNALLRAAVDYQPPPPTHFIRRPRNLLIDPPDDA